MAQIDITHMSSKGQVVIPFELREGIKEGEKLVIIRNNEQIILKKTNSFDKNLEEDLKFAKKTEEAWQQILAGKGKKYSQEEFFKRLHNGKFRNL